MGHQGRRQGREAALCQGQIGRQGRRDDPNGRRGPEPAVPERAGGVREQGAAGEARRDAEREAGGLLQGLQVLGRPHLDGLQHRARRGRAEHRRQLEPDARGQHEG